MVYIIGLGNPGKKFRITRHNAGYIILDKIREKFSFPEFEINKKITARLSRGMIKNKNITLVKSNFFMNDSGKTVQKLLSYHKETSANIIVIHDDIDLKMGKVKISRDSRSAGHNGIQDIIDKIGTQKFTRIRFGVSNEKIRSRIEPADFVLENFSRDELATLENSISDVFPLLLKILQEKT